VQRDGRLAVERRGEILWRSSDRYRLYGTADYLEATALSGRAVAFSFNHSALYVARFGEPERIVARGEHPLLWARGGLLTYRWSREGTSFFVRASDGRLLRRLATHVESFAVDRGRRSLLFVTPSGLLARADGERLELLADVGALANPGVELADGGLITVFSDGGKRVLVLDSDGQRFASATVARYPSAVSVSPDGGAIAFVVTRWSGDDALGADEVVVLSRGGSAAVRIYARDHHGSPCGRTAALTWRGDDLLYWTSEGAVVVLDSRGERPAVDLTATAAGLPGVRPEWAAASPG
jgi:hypothetical protein